MKMLAGLDFGFMVRFCMEVEIYKGICYNALRDFLYLLICIFGFFLNKNVIFFSFVRLKGDGGSQI